jgi:hypothetical protein
MEKIVFDLKASVTALNRFNELRAKVLGGKATPEEIKLFQAQDDGGRPKWVAMLKTDEREALQKAIRTTPT